MQLSSVRVSLCGMRDMVFQNAEGSCHIKTLPHFSIVQSVTGSYEVQLGRGEPQHTGPGGLFIAPPQCLQTITHHMDAASAMHARWIFFDMELNGAYSAEYLFDFPAVPPPETSARLNVLLDALFAASDPCDRMSLCYQLAKELLHIAAPKSASINQELLRVVDHLKQHYNEKISIRMLAELIHISESNLYASFQKQFHQSPIAYLNDYRLAVASKLLKSSDESIDAIAQKVGIDDARYFAKMFKRKYQLTPTAYRRSVLL